MGGDGILIAYFSHADGTGDAGHTATVARMVGNMVPADSMRIRRIEPYPQDHAGLIEEAKREKAERARPVLDELPGSMDGYGTLILGYPNWCGDLPMPVYSFLESVDLSGMRVMPYCTNGGGGLNSTRESIAELCPDSEVTEALSVADSDLETSEPAVRDWLERNLGTR